MTLMKKIKTIGFTGLLLFITALSPVCSQDQALYTLTLNQEEILRDTVGQIPEFPKYTTQLMNLANQNAQGTRPKVVGQMSELIQEFPGKDYEEWVKWYRQQKPEAIDQATAKVYAMLLNLRKAMENIDETLVRKWVEDLVLTKTYAGLKFQKSILARVSEIKGQPYRLAEPGEESKGIDGYIGQTPVSIKPVTYSSKPMLNEDIPVAIIYYEKVKTGIKISYAF
jgi:hypothetical protein